MRHDPGIGKEGLPVVGDVAAEVVGMEMGVDHQLHPLGWDPKAFQSPGHGTRLGSYLRRCLGKPSHTRVDHHHPITVGQQETTHADADPPICCPARCLPGGRIRPGKDRQGIGVIAPVLDGVEEEISEGQLPEHSARLRRCHSIPP